MITRRISSLKFRQWVAIGYIGFAVIALLSVIAGKESIEQPRPESGSIVVLVVPGLDWGDISEATTPGIAELAADATVGVMATRTVQPQGTVADGMATISAGRRAEVSSEALTAARDSNWQGEGFAELRADAAKGPYDPNVGTLGTALQDLPLTTIASSNTDGQMVLANNQGVIGERVVIEAAQFYSDDSSDQIVATAKQAIPGSVVAIVTPEFDGLVNSSQLDELTHDLTEQMGPADSLLIVTPAATDNLGVYLQWSTESRSALATSATTRRAGVVTITDVAPTIVSLAGQEHLGSLVDGTEIGAIASSSAYKTVNRLHDESVVREKSTAPIITVLCLTVLASVLIAMTAFRLRFTNTAIRVAGSIASFAALFWIGLSYATGLFNTSTWSSTTYLVAIGLVGLLAAVLLEVVCRRLNWNHQLVIGIISAALVAVLAIDFMFQSELQLNTPLGYGIVDAGRFVGSGNVSTAIMVALTIVAAVAIPRSENRVRANVLAAVALPVVLVIGVPQWGSDVGGVVCAAAAFFVAVSLLREGRLNLMKAALAVIAGVAVLMIAVVIDSIAAANSQSHLGRFVDRVFEGGGATVISRKLSAIGTMFSDFPLLLLVPVVLGLLALWLLRPTPSLKRFLNEHDYMSAVLWAVVVGGAAGALANDSGVVLPGVMLTCIVPLTVVLLIESSRKERIAVGSRR